MSGDDDDQGHCGLRHRDHYRLQRRRRNPVVVHPTYNTYIPSLIFGQLLSGTNFDDTSRKGHCFFSPEPQ